MLSFTSKKENKLFCFSRAYVYDAFIPSEDNIRRNIQLVLLMFEFMFIFHENQRLGCEISLL